MKAAQAFTYAESVLRLEALQKTQGMNFEFSRSFKFSEVLGDPHKAYPTIHVGGTNGKGSVAGKIARSLTLAGYKTGLYTSPHLLDFCERIDIDGKLISKEDFAALINEGFAVNASQGLQATAFELLTMMSFLHFKRQATQVAVVEVGLGGRLDTTNVINPALSVITSIGYDHMHLLGQSIGEIAWEKAGIIKPGIPVVVGPNAVQPVLQERARSLNSEILSVPGSSRFETSDQENSRIARIALQRLSRDFQRLTEESIEKGLEYCPRARKQLVTCKNATLLIDAGHNVSALSRLFYDLANEYPKYRFQAVMGMCADKDAHSCVKEVAKHVEKIHFVSASAPRLLPHSRLWQLGMEIDPYVVGASGEVGDVLGQLIDSAEKGQLFVVCGSFFIMPAVEEQLKQRGVSLKL